MTLIRPQCSPPKLFRALSLGLLLVPALALAQPQYLEPIGDPVPVTTRASDAPKPPQSSTNRENVEHTIQHEMRSALEDGLGSDARLALLIPILAVIFIFGGPLIAVMTFAILHYRSKNQKARLRAEAVLRALETGRELPPELLDDKPDRTPDNLQKGIKNVGLGVGLAVAFTLMVGIEIGAIGFILIGIGAAQLLIWKLNDSANQDAA